MSIPPAISAIQVCRCTRHAMPRSTHDVRPRAVDAMSGFEKCANDRMANMGAIRAWTGWTWCFRLPPAAGIRGDRPRRAGGRPLDAGPNRGGWSLQMSEPPSRPRPEVTERAQADKQARAERAAAALRANLRKRKAQARARDAGPARDPKGRAG